jgi:hypothetical protein
MNSKDKNIPEPPRHPVEHHTVHRQESKSKSPVKKTLIPEKFHEGHEKDIPNSKDFMEHTKFEKMQHIADEHLGGPIETSEHKTESTEKKGVWDKTKEVISKGIDKIKHIFK